MNPTTKIKPLMLLPDRFFVKSIDDYTTHPTLDEAISDANERIQDCLCDGWDEDAVRAVEYGVIMGGAEMFDKRPDPKGDFDYLCSYQAAPLKDPGLFESKGLNAIEAAVLCHISTGIFDEILDQVRLEVKDTATKVEVYAFIVATLLNVATKKGGE